LEPLLLIAVDEEQKLIVAAPPPIASWTRERFKRLIAGAADRVGRELRFATELSCTRSAVPSRDLNNHDRR
jgi:hypothetical protein